MEILFAPMEGITTSLLRTTHNNIFPGIDYYFAPFMVACQHSGFKEHELKDLMPERNIGYNLIPQLLSNDAESFVFAARQLSAMGYKEVNLNLGCPSGTVVSKHRGSGMLVNLDELKFFLDDIFSVSDLSISIKTRLGFSDPEDFFRILEIYNNYPLSRLIIHARVRQDMYKNKPNLSIFSWALKNSRIPVSFNGDIFTLNDYNALVEHFPELKSIMVGRGIIGNPGLARQILNGTPLTIEEFRLFHDCLYSSYKKFYMCDRNVLHKMKELWYYMSDMFSDHEKAVKRLMKSQKYYDYESAVNAIFRDCKFDPMSGFKGTK